jgi:PAS domain S-box-containing protein
MKQDSPKYLGTARGLFDEAPCGYLHLDRGGRILAINRTLLDWLGYREEEVAQQLSFSDLLPMGGKMYYETHHFPLENLQGYVRELSYDLVRKDGSRFPVLVTSKQMTPADGEHEVFYRYIVFNITDRRQYEKELLQAKKTAEAASRAKDIFLGRVSHEIRTPVHAILSMADFIAETELAPEQRAMLNTLRFSANSLLDFIGEVHELSKLDAGQMTLHEQDFPIEEMGHQLVRHTEVLLRDKPVAVRYSCSADIPEFLHGDVIKLQRVLDNLLVNAAQHTERGHVALHIAPELITASNCRLHFRVADTGIGMADEQLKALFEPLLGATDREDRAAETLTTGSLSLAICRQLVALLGGKLSVSSTPGEGTEFSFSLRFARGATPAQPQRPELQDLSLDGLRVLLVEDNHTNIYIAARILRKRGAAVAVAENGKDAIDLATEEDYDIILMDLQMPILDGLAATQQIRQLDRHAATPIVALTAAESPEIDTELAKAGMNGCLLKPFGAENLLSTILAHCEERLAALSPDEDLGDWAFSSTSVDPAGLYELIGPDDREGCRELLAAIRIDLQRQQSRLGKTVRERDVAGLRAIRHALKTVLRLVQPQPLGRLLERSADLLGGQPAASEVADCAAALDRALAAAIQDIDVLQEAQ